MTRRQVSRPTNDEGSVWQAYADLAMGLMGVFLLVLVVLLRLQAVSKQDVERERDEIRTSISQVERERDEIRVAMESVERERDEIQTAKLQVEQERDEARRTLEVAQEERRLLEEERRRFALELLAMLDSSYLLVDGQDLAEAWLTGVFEEGSCDLAVDDKGRLLLSGRARGAQLYASGAVSLSPEGRAALASCRDNFVRLATCLSPASDPETGDVDRVARCLGVGDESDAELVKTLRRGIEALVLQGNTDRVTLGGAIPGIVGATGLRGASNNFARNAYLGAERARQAMGNLLALTSEHNKDEFDAMAVMMSRLRVETPSFGRYLAGPAEWREPGCANEDDCEAARNIALRIRWKKQELRRPLEGIRESVCDLLLDESSGLFRGLEAAGRDPRQERERFDCAQGAP